MSKPTQAQAVNEMYSRDSAFGQDTPKLVEAPPCADYHGLRELGAMEFFPRRWQYGHKNHTLRDMMVPGYFRDDARDWLHVGDEITYTMCGGEKDPVKWDRGICVVIEKSSHREQPVVLAGIHRFKKPTSWAGATALENGDDEADTKGRKKLAR